MSEERITVPHNVTLHDRERMTLTGVNEVVSYDEEGAIFDTSLGRLCIDGCGIQLTRLDLGRNEADITGKINALAYIDKKQSKGFFGRK